MKNTKVNGLFKKIVLILLLISLALVAFISNVFLFSEKIDVSTYNAVANKTPLYEVDCFYNIVILTELSDAKFNKNIDYPIIEKAFNDVNSNSLRKYYKEQSGERLDVISVFMFYSSSTTTSAFKKLKSENQTPFVNKALSGDIYLDINKNNKFEGDLDANDDGLIDSVTLYLPLTITGDDSETAAWPHTIIGNSNFSHKFRGLNYNRYVINSYRYKSDIITIDAPIGVMCHEMFHNIGNDIGIQDLYHYPDDDDRNFVDLVPVGNYCIMASTDYVNPQPLNVYYKSKLGWAELISAETGAVSLSKTKAEGLKFGANDSEFFIAQFWKANSYNGIGLQSGEEGVIIYRVNTSVTTGNMGNINNKNPDKKDEIYVFRKGLNQEREKDFSAVLTDSYKNLTYSNGENAQINIRIEIKTDDVVIYIERYAVEFRINGELVPYKISVRLNNGEQENTSSGAYVFEFKDIANGRVDFECFGYEFYRDSELNERITYVMLNAYGLNEEKFIITVFVKAIPRDIAVYFKDFEGNNLSFSLSSIDYIFEGHEGTFLVENYYIELNASKNFQVKNGDKIYFELEINGDRYRKELLEVTPDIKTEATIQLAKLCRIEGTILNKGLPLPNVQIFVDGEYIRETDSDGKFALEDIAQGSIISFELKNYKIDDFRVTQDDLNLIITAQDLSDSSRIVIIVASVIIGIIIIATIVSVCLSKKRDSYMTNEHFDE